MSEQALDLSKPADAGDRPLDAWPDDFESALPPDPATEDDFARAWRECDSDLARHLASIPEPPDSPEPPPVTVFEFEEEALADCQDTAATILAALDPGPGSAVLVGMLNPARMTPASVVGVIAATEKLASWVQALQHRWLAAFTAPGMAATRDGLLAYASAPGQPLHRSRQPESGSVESAGGGDDPDLPFSGPTVHGDADLDHVINEAAFKVAAAEVSAALHFSPVTAQRRVRQALDFTMDLPATLHALSHGRIDRGRALTILDRTENLSAELRRRVETAVLPKATNRTPGQLRGIVDRAVISVDPAAAKKRQIKAREERHVTVRPNRDGMSTFIAEVGAEHAGVAFSVLDRVATSLHRRADESRRIGALRADVFSDIFDQLATQGAVDLRATFGGRAVITHDPLKYSWISDTSTIADRYDADTSLIDPHPGNPGRPASDPNADASSMHTPADNPDTPDVDADTTLGRSDATTPRTHTERADDTIGPCDPLTDGSARPEANSPDVRSGEDNTRPGESADESDVLDFESASPDDVRCNTGAFDEEGSSDQPPSTDFAPTSGVDMGACTALDECVTRGAHPYHHFPIASGSLSAGRVAPVPGSPPAGPVSPGPDSAQAGPAGPGPESAPRDNRPIGRPFSLPTQQGRLTHLNVTIAATTLGGLDDLPGELDGYGPIPADLCRALAISAASITAVAVDATCGTALDIGRATYRPRLSHRDHVTQRDRTCRFPGCRQPARRCQIDHSEEFCDGGPTCPCNLACLCKFHHDLKTTGLWDALQHPDASITWTSPTGRKYRTHTPEWPLATAKDQPGKNISHVADIEGCSTGTALTSSVPGHAASGYSASGNSATAPAASDDPPF